MIALVLRSDGGQDRVRIDAPGVGQDVDQHRARADVDHRRHRGDPGHVGDDHFIARPDPQRRQRQMQGRRRVRQADGVRDADVVGQHALEAGVEGVVVPVPGGARRLGRELGLALGDPGAGDRDALGGDDHGRSSTRGGQARSRSLITTGA